MTSQNIRLISGGKKKRAYLEKVLKIKLENIGSHSFSENEVAGRNIENLIGAVSIPLGIAGPINLKSGSKKSSHYIPLATTEGALVASVSRGIKAINLSGGADVYTQKVGTTRGPVFKTRNIAHAKEVEKFLEKNFSNLAKTASKTSSHLKLTKYLTQTIGKNLYIRFSFDTSDAMGMNMATIATDSLAKIIEAKTKAVCISIAGNFDIDKKPAYLNFVLGRGIRAWAEVTIKENIVKEILKITPKKLADTVYRKCQIGSIASGSLGANAHHANIVAAIFLATGQDIAHIVEGSIGTTTAETDKDGNLYFSVYLPALMIGTVGGGTHIPSQNEAIKIMQVKNPQELAEVVAGAVLAGELSLLASQTEGTLSKAHQKLGRKK